MVGHKTFHVAHEYALYDFRTFQFDVGYQCIHVENGVHCCLGSPGFCRRYHISSYVCQTYSCDVVVLPSVENTKFWLSKRCVPARRFTVDNPYNRGTGASMLSIVTKLWRMKVLPNPIPTDFNDWINYK